MDQQHLLIKGVSWFYSNFVGFGLISYNIWWNNVCSIKFRSKHSTVLVLCLLRNLMEQSLCHSFFKICLRLGNLISSKRPTKKIFGSALPLRRPCSLSTLTLTSEHLPQLTSIKNSFAKKNLHSISTHQLCPVNDVKNVPPKYFHECFRRNFFFKIF